MTETTHDVVQRADQLPAHKALNPAIAEILRLNPSPEALDKLLATQERYEANEAKKAYARALVELKRALPPFLIRDKDVSFNGKFMYSHTSLAAAMETVKPMLIEHGFALTWESPTPSKPGLIAVSAVLTHRDGHRSDPLTYEAGPETGGQKSGPQAVASTITLLQRYTAMSLLGLATADMHEPTGEGKESAPTPEKIDSKKNLTVMSELAKAGKTKAEAEANVGRPVQQWTAADLAKLKEWATPAKSKREQLIEAASKNGWEEYQVKARLEEMGFKGSIPADRWEETLRYFAEHKPSAGGSAG